MDTIVGFDGKNRTTVSVSHATEPAHIFLSCFAIQRPAWALLDP
jgi:hypothetical protein